MTVLGFQRSTENISDGERVVSLCDTSKLGYLIKVDKDLRSLYLSMSYMRKHRSRKTSCTTNPRFSSNQTNLVIPIRLRISLYWTVVSVSTLTPVTSGQVL